VFVLTSAGLKGGGFGVLSGCVPLHELPVCCGPRGSISRRKCKVLLGLQSFPGNSGTTWKIAFWGTYRKKKIALLFFTRYISSKQKIALI